jgi:hypothetical protein
MAIELKSVREDDIHGIVAGSVFVDGVFVCHEYGNTPEELWDNFKSSQELYPLILKDDFEKDCI